MDFRYSSNYTKFGTPVLLITLNTINKVSELVERGINTKNMFKDCYCQLNTVLTPGRYVKLIVTVYQNYHIVNATK